MSDEITPQAKPIATSGEPAWYPPPADDDGSTPAPQRRGIRWVFYGPDGLRAGWSLLLWALVIALLSRGVGLILRHLYPVELRRGRPVPEGLVLANSTIGFLVTGLAGFVVSRVERRPFRAYGIGSLRGRFGDFAWGLTAGFGTLSVLIFLLWRMHAIVFGGLLLRDARSIVIWGVLYGLAFLGTGLFEEFTFRGFPQFTLTRGIAGILRSIGMQDHASAVAFWITALLLAVVFGAVHAGNPGEAKTGLFAAGLIGFLFACSLWRTGSLWWAIGWHAAWDWGESFFYGTADSGGVSPHRLMESHPVGNAALSGGSVGPEGSILVFVAILLTAVIILTTLRSEPGSPSARGGETA